MLQLITAIAAVFMGSSSPHIIRQCPCPGSLEFGITWSSKCCHKDDKSPKPPPKPDDSNTCEPTPPSCTGQWCTSCDEVGCIDIDGPGITASLCDGEFSWCTDDSCHVIEVGLVDELDTMSPSEIVDVLASDDGPPPPTAPGMWNKKTIVCPNGYSPYWHAGTSAYRCGRAVPVK